MVNPGEICHISTTPAIGFGMSMALRHLSTHLMFPGLRFDIKGALAAMGYRGPCGMCRRCAYPSWMRKKGKRLGKLQFLCADSCRRCFSIIYSSICRGSVLSWKTPWKHLWTVAVAVRPARCKFCATSMKKHEETRHPRSPLHGDNYSIQLYHYSTYYRYYTTTECW